MSLAFVNIITTRLQEAAVAADQATCVALARLEELNVQLADVGQRLAAAMVACRSAAAIRLADLQALTEHLEVATALAHIPFRHICLVQILEACTL